MAFLKQKAFNGRCPTPLSNAFRFENNTLSAEFWTVAITPAAMAVTQRTERDRTGEIERDREIRTGDETYCIHTLVRYIYTCVIH